MNRLRIILYAAALLAGVSACDKEELPDTGASLSPGERILFSAPPELTVETLTRAAQDGFTEGNAFGVMAYCVPYNVGENTLNYGSGSADWSTKRSNCAPEVLYNQKVTVAANGCTYDHTNSSGDSNNPAYWYRDGYGTDGKENTGVTGAANYRYTFFAWYPYADAEGKPYFTFSKPTGQTDKGAPVVTFTMPQEGSNTDTELSKDTPDAMLAVLYNRTKADGSLTFDFSHVLTGLGFEVNNFSENELKIHRLTLSGKFYRQVTVDFSKATSATDFFTFPASYYTGEYVLFDESANGGKPLELAATSETTSVTSTNDIDGQTPIGGSHLLLISGSGSNFGPETTGNEVVKVNLTYTFDAGQKTESFSRPSTFTPQPGVKYTAQLNFVGNAFVLQFVVDNNESWEDGGTDNDNDNDGQDDTATFE